MPLHSTTFPQDFTLNYSTRGGGGTAPLNTPTPLALSRYPLSPAGPDQITGQEYMEMYNKKAQLA